MILDGVRLTQVMFGEALDPRTYLVRMYPDSDGVVPPLAHVVLTARPLLARVNQGVWIAACDCGAPRTKIPTPGGVVFFDGPGAGLVWCLRCQNGPTGRGWRPVIAPPPETRSAIEAVLELRPQVGDRNWEPDETVGDLIAQNLEHGDPVPTGSLTGTGPRHGPFWQELVTPFKPLPLTANRLRRLAGRLVRR